MTPGWGMVVIRCRTCLELDSLVQWNAHFLENLHVAKRCWDRRVNGGDRVNMDRMNGLCSDHLGFHASQVSVEHVLGSIDSDGASRRSLQFDHVLSLLHPPREDQAIYVSFFFRGNDLLDRELSVPGLRSRQMDTGVGRR
jgi:hypothetical protein